MLKDGSGGGGGGGGATAVGFGNEMELVPGSAGGAGGEQVQQLQITGSSVRD